MEYVVGVSIALIILTIIAGWEYYKHIMRAHKEYAKAHDVVEDIIVSINREMRREAAKIETMEYKIAGATGKLDNFFMKVENTESKILPIEKRVEGIVDDAATMTVAITNITNKILMFEKDFASLKERLIDFEERNKLPISQEGREEPVIQLRREKAIGALTDTEISVLEMLAKEGSKTAPEIKNNVRLSREHTARLMKKLYEGGYVERETGKMPFRYSVKKEMEALLQKPQTDAV